MKAQYVVMGMNAQGKPAFYDEDHHSGGYPYASTFLGKRTDDILKAVAWMKQCGPKKMCDITDAKVYRIDLVHVDIAAVEADQRIVSDMINDMTPEQLAIMKKELGK